MKRSSRTHPNAHAIITLVLLLHSPALIVAQPQTPAIQEVEIVADWGATDPGIIWSDDFEAAGPLNPRYQDVGGNGGRFASTDGAGIGGSRGIRQQYDSGQVSAGWAWRFFGDHPSVRGAQQREVWTRFYHRFDTGFIGVPPKMARMGTFGWDDWTLAFMAHYWWATRGANRGRAVADVASNIALGSDQPIERGYNKLSRWLPVAVSSFNADTVPNKGRWICYEMRVKLNDPNVANGEYDYWADGQRIISVRERNLVAGYAARGINAVQLDTYWNEGSPRAQSRFYDNFVIATRPIGPARSSRTPLVRKTPFVSFGDLQRSWELEIATAERRETVWRSGEIAGDGDSIRVDATTGAFLGMLAGARMLEGEQLYVGRVRVRGERDDWSDWSPWHGAILTERAEPPLAIDAGAAERSFRLSPKSAADRIIVEGIGTAPSRLLVADLLGRTVLVQHASAGAAIDVSTLSPGSYVVLCGSHRARLVIAR
jgi:hypothetical protein